MAASIATSEQAAALTALLLFFAEAYLPVELSLTNHSAGRSAGSAVSASDKKECPKNQGNAPKERGRRRAGKRSSKRVFLESPFRLCPLKVCS